MLVREFFPVEVLLSLAVAYAAVLGSALIVALAVGRLKAALAARRPAERSITLVR
jgi:hypothetical protein